MCAVQCPAGAAVSSTVTVTVIRRPGASDPSSRLSRSQGASSTACHWIVVPPELVSVITVRLPYSPASTVSCPGPAGAGGSSTESSKRPAPWDGTGTAAP
ncbi:hypothetical protein GCM10025734_40110 [Kitasatospora paranensis]